MISVYLADTDTFLGIEDPVTRQLVDGHRIALVVTEDELHADIAAYDPSSGTSPSVTVCRKYVRAMFDAYIAARAAAGLPPIPTIP